MAAFRFCLGRCRMVELDVRLSADGEVVVCHDDTLVRTSNAREFAPEAGPACRDSLRVDAWPLAALRRLDMGGWFRERGAGGGAKFPPYAPSCRETMPTLAETLAWAKRHAMPLNLELKGQGSEERDKFLALAVTRSIAAFGAAELALLSSFHFRLLADCLRLAPGVSRALLYAGPPPADLFGKLAALRACACHPEHHDLDADLLRRLHAAGYLVNTWTVNEAPRRRELAEMGVDGLITDFPET